MSSLESNLTIMPSRKRWMVFTNVCRHAMHSRKGQKSDSIDSVQNCTQADKQRIENNILLNALFYSYIITKIISKISKPDLNPYCTSETLLAVTLAKIFPAMGWDASTGHDGLNDV